MAIDINIHVKNIESGIKELQKTGAPKELQELAKQISALIQTIGELRSAIVDKIGILSRSGYQTKDITSVGSDLSVIVDLAKELNAATNAMKNMSRASGGDNIAPILDRIEKAAHEAGAAGKSEIRATVGDVELKIDLSKTEDQLKHVVSEAMDKVAKANSDTMRHISMAETRRAASTSADPTSNRLSADIQKNTAALQSVISSYKTFTIQPGADQRFKVEMIGGDRANPEVLKIEKNVNKLSESLLKLQDTIEKNVKASLPKGGEILPTESGRSFGLAKGGKEWELQIVNIQKLKMELRDLQKNLSSGSGISVDVKLSKNALELRDMFKQAYIQTKLEKVESSPGVMAKDVERWLSRLHPADIKNETVSRLHESVVKNKTASTVYQVKGVEQSQIKNLYRSQVLPEQALEEFRKKFVNAISVPAATLSKQGTIAFETKSGASKTSSDFAKLNTGLERLLKDMSVRAKLDAKSTEYYQNIIETMPLRLGVKTPGKSDTGFKREVDEANKLISEMVYSIKQATGGQGSELLKTGYKRAIAFRATERITDPSKAKEKAKDYLETDRSLAELEKTAEQVGVSLVDVAKALDRIDFSNFYDMLNSIYSAEQQGKSLLSRKLNQASTMDVSSRAFRDISKEKERLMGYLPLEPAGQPKRGAYNERVVSVSTRGYVDINEVKRGGETVKEARERRLEPTEQKAHIIDINLLSKDIDKMNKAIGDSAESVRLYSGTMSDTASATLREKQLKGPHKRYIVSLSREEIREQAPFREFASQARQQSYTSAAFTGPGFTRPNIMSATEEQMMKSGRWGTGGYGHKSVVQLQNTAGTWEDQILIDAGSTIAKSFVEIVKPMLAPSGGVEGTSNVEPGLKRLSEMAAKNPEMLAKYVGTKEFDEALKKVANKIQTVMGVDEKYTGRADLAGIKKDIVSVMKESGGKSIEVQSAQLVEVFMNYFGRKFATRFGTKGVSMTTTNVQSMEDVVDYAKKGFDVKFSEGRGGLGYVKKVKDMGVLAADLIEKTFDDESSTQLSEELRKSGNKFIIDLFTDASKGLVTEEEARKNAELQRKAFSLLKALPEVRGLKSDVSGIKTLREAHAERFGPAAQMETTPVDVRISSRGMAKRGLPEAMLAMTEQLSGFGAEKTVIKDRPENVITMSESSRAEMKALHEALGYSPFKDIEGIKRNLKLEGLDPSKKAGAEEAIQKLIEAEQQFSVYLDTITEYGELVQTITAPMFVQDVSPVHQYKEKSLHDVSEGTIPLNPQALSAYYAQFGPDSKVLQEIMSGTSSSSREGWEAVKVFQMAQSKRQKEFAEMMTGLTAVDIKQLKMIDERTATPEDIKGSPFDISRYPAAFKVNVPTGLQQGTEGPELKRKEFYVPGAALRQTFMDPLLGEQALTDVSRSLSNYLSAVQRVEKTAAGGAELTPELVDRIIGEQINAIEEAVKNGSISGMDQLRAQLEPFLSIIKKTEATTPFGSGGDVILRKFEEFIGHQKQKPQIEGMGNVVRRLRDIMSGQKEGGPAAEINRWEKIADVWESTPGDWNTKIDVISKQKDLKGWQAAAALKRSNLSAPEFLEKKIRPFQEPLAAYKGLVDLEASNLDMFSSVVSDKLGTAVESALNKALESAARAETQYYNTVASTIFGKKGGIESTFFSRQIPESVTAKATVGISNKVEDFESVIKTLESLGNFDDVIQQIEGVKEKHAKNIEMARKRGIPILKEREVGISEHIASQIKTKSATGEDTTLADLIKSGESAPVSTVRFPFTGAHSIQAFQGKLLEDSLTGMSKHTIAVAGAPELDMPALNDILQTIESRIVEKTTAREKIWGAADEAGTPEATAEATAAAKAMTDEINTLIGALKQLTPKYHSMEQKLDFDGDTIYLHSASVKEARDEIEKQIGMLDSNSEQLTSVRSLYNTMFTKYNESSARSVAEQIQVFSKKHPGEKGFEFLTKPYLKEDVANIAAEGKEALIKTLFEYEKRAYQAKDLDEYRPLIEQDISSEVERRAGTSLDPGSKADLEKKMLSERLYERKLEDSIQGQLYKLDTGMTVEGMRRLAYITERETGFGGGIGGGGGTAPPSAEFAKRWPKESVVLGGRPVEEFQTRMQEILRFVIQKGMDVKHAGTRSVAQDILSNVGKEGGVSDIADLMGSDEKSYSELLDFNKKIEESVRLRLGALSTDEIKAELNKFLQGTGEAISDDVSGLDREGMIKEIVAKVDLRATFEELFRQIQKQAVEGLTKKTHVRLKELAASPDKKSEYNKLIADVEKSGGVRAYAEKKIAYQASKGGIDLVSNIVEAENPLYQLRTSSVTSPSSVASSRLSDLSFKGVASGKSYGPAQERYEKMQEAIEKSAYVVSDAVKQSFRSKSRDISAYTTSSTVFNRLKEIQELQKIEGQLGEPSQLNLVKEAIPSSKFVTDMWADAVNKSKASTKDPFADEHATIQQILSTMERNASVKQRAASGLLEPYAAKAGLPSISPQESFQLFEDKLKTDPSISAAYDKIGEVAEKGRAIALQRGATEQEAEEFVVGLKNMHEDTLRYFVVMNEQADRISSVIKTLSAESSYIRSTFGVVGGGLPPTGGTTPPSQEISGALNDLNSLFNVSKIGVKTASGAELSKGRSKTPYAEYSYSGAGEGQLAILDDVINKRDEIAKKISEESGTQHPQIFKNDPIKALIYHEGMHHLDEVLGEYAKYAHKAEELYVLYTQVKQSIDKISKTDLPNYAGESKQEAFADIAAAVLLGDESVPAAEEFKKLFAVLKQRKAKTPTKRLAMFGGEPPEIPPVDSYEDDYIEPTFYTDEMINEEYRNMEYMSAGGREDMSRFEELMEQERTRRQTALDPEQVKALRDRLSGVSQKLTGGVNIQKDVPKFEWFRASSLKAGGGFKGGDQLEAILSDMLFQSPPNMLMEAASFRGTALHEEVQKEYEEKYGAQAEGLVTDAVNRISGHFDLLYDKIIGDKKTPVLGDIKTVYGKEAYNRMEAIGKEISSGKFSNLREYLAAQSPKDLKSDDVLRRLQDYIGQINFYMGAYRDESGNQLKDVMGEVIAINQRDPSKRTVIPVGGFSESEYSKSMGEVAKAREYVEKLLSADSGKEMSDIMAAFPNISEKVGAMTPEKLKHQLPMTAGPEGLLAAEEAADAYKKMSHYAEEIAQFNKESAEYLSIVDRLMGERGGAPARQTMEQVMMFGPGSGAAGGAGAPPGGAPPTGGGGGGGFDDDDDLNKRIRDIIKNIRESGRIKIEQQEQLISILNELEEKLKTGTGAGVDKYRRAAKDIEQVLGDYGGVDTAQEVYESLNRFKTNMNKSTNTTYRTVDVDELNPDSPEGMHKNLLALYENAAEYWKFDPDQFSDTIKAALKDVESVGPNIDSAKELIANLDKMEPNERGKKLFGVWRHYRSSVAKYFLNRLDELSKQMDEAEAVGAQGALASLQGEYKGTIKEWRKYIQGSLHKQTDIYTTKAPMGKGREFLAPDIARLLNIYRTPDQIQAVSRQRLPEQLQPIMSTLTNDLDVENVHEMASALEKVRKAFDMMANVDPNFKRIAADADLFNRKGEEAAKAWDLGPLVENITLLRGALQTYHQLRIEGFGEEGDDYVEVMRQNVENMIKYLKSMEKDLVPPGGPESSAFGITAVPGMLDFEQQELLHKRNLASIREYFAKGAEAGGAAVGQTFSYKERIMDPSSKQVITNIVHKFRKTAEEPGEGGDATGVFKESTEDLIESWQSRKGLGQAFRRVATWGFASSAVWQSVDALKAMVDTIQNVEFQIATLRQVMNPLTTDFSEMSDAAMGFAKEFGQPVEKILDSMRIFAQQGLSQAEVIDRTKTAALAGNVTTLNASEATEALTSAMKVYGKEGESAVRILDAWSQVESRHAITSGDLGNAIKKAAAAAKTSGISFDQLNAVVTGIGETTRQTGKEIGTAGRFIFRNIFSEKGVEALSGAGVQPITETGDLRSAFDVLGDLAGAWKGLSNAQQLATAQAIGGRWHYNSVIVLLEHWDDVLRALENSTNSKGAADRRNAIIMETYAKKVEQVRATMAKLQVEFGKVALPFAKAGLDSLTFLLETISKIPTSLKVAFVAFAGLFTVLAKGQSIISGISDGFSGFGETMGSFFGSGMKDIRTGVYEVFGKELNGVNIEGLKTIVDAKSVKDMESTFGQLGYVIANTGRSWNLFLADVVSGAAQMSSVGGGVFDSVGNKLFGVSKVAASRKLLRTAATAAALGTGAKGAAFTADKMAEYTGVGAEGLSKLAGPETTFGKSVGPTIASAIALAPAVKLLYDGLKRLTSSAVDYENSMDAVRRTHSDELSNIRSLLTTYENYSDLLEKTKKQRTPEEIQLAVERGRYDSPLLEGADAAEKLQEHINKAVNSNYSLVEGFDKYGNAILTATGNLKDHLKVLESSKINEALKTELDILSKYAEDLTDTGFVEGLKGEFKKLLAETPVLGEFSKSISVSPAKELQDAIGRMNLLAGDQASMPLAPIGESLKAHQKELDDARARFMDSYKNAKRVVAELDFTGLSESEIQEKLTKPFMNKIYEVILEIDPVIKHARETTGADIDISDVRSSEILKRIGNEATSAFIGATGSITTERFRAAQVLEREGKAFTDDVVIFNKKIADSFGIAGAQGVLDVTAEGAFIKYIDMTGQISKISWTEADVSNAVEAIFPVTRIQEGLEENIEILNELVVGATAGLSGIFDKKAFNKEIGLGARFFSDISTESLLQTDRGYSPATGAFGGAGYKTGWVDDFKLFVDEFKKLREMMAPGEVMEEVEGATITTGKMEELKVQQDIVRNNQVVMQFRSVIEDLTKSMEATTRAAEQEIMVEQARAKILIQTHGLLSGLPENIKEINIGKQLESQLSDQEQLLYKEQALPTNLRTFTKSVSEYGELGIRKQSLANQAEGIAKARADIMALERMYGPEGYNQIMGSEQLQQYMELMQRTGGDVGVSLGLPYWERTAEGTERTAVGIEQLIAAQEPFSGVVDKLNKYNKENLKIMSSEELRGNILELAEKRAVYSSAGRSDAEIEINKVLNSLSAELVRKMGATSASEFMRSGMVDYRTPGMADDSFIGSGGFGEAKSSFTESEFIQRAISGSGGPDAFKRIMSKAMADSDIVSARMKAVNPINVYGDDAALYEDYYPTRVEKPYMHDFMKSSEMKELQELVFSEAPDTSTGKTAALITGSMVGVMDILRRSIKREMDQFDADMRGLKSQRDKAIAQYEAGEIDQSKLADVLKPIDEELSVLYEKRSKAGQVYKERFISELIGIGSTAGGEISRRVSPELSKIIEVLGVGTVGTMGTAYAASAITGQTVPEAYTAFLARWEKLINRGLYASGAAGGVAGTVMGGPVGGIAGSILGSIGGWQLGKKLKEWTGGDDSVRRSIEAEILRGPDLTAEGAASIAMELRDNNETVGSLQEQALTESQTQTALLSSIDQGIEDMAGEQATTTSTTEGSDKSRTEWRKELRQRVTEQSGRRFDERRLKDFMFDALAPTIAAAVTGYTFESGRFDRERGIQIDRGGRIEQIFEDIYKSPKKRDALLEIVDLLAQGERVDKSIASGETAVEIGSRVLDVNEAKLNIDKELTLRFEKVMSESLEIAARSAEIESSAASKLLQQTISNGIQSMFSKVAAEVASFSIDMAYRTAGTGPMKGLGEFPEIQLPPGEHELSGTQRMWRAANTTAPWLKDMMMSFKELSSIRDTGIDYLKQLEGNIRESTTMLPTALKKESYLPEMFSDAVKNSEKKRADYLEDLETERASKRKYLEKGIDGKVVMHDTQLLMELSDAIKEVGEATEAGKSLRQLHDDLYTFAKGAQDVVSRGVLPNLREQVRDALVSRVGKPELGEDVRKTSMVFDSIRKAGFEIVDGVEKSLPVYQEIPLSSLPRELQTVDELQRRMVQGFKEAAGVTDDLISPLEFLSKFGMGKPEAKLRLGLETPPEFSGYVKPLSNDEILAAINSVDSEFSKLALSMTDGAKESQQLAEQTSVLKAEYERVGNILKPVISDINKLEAALQFHVSVHNLVGEIQRLTMSFNIAQESSRMNTEHLDKMIGGSDPYARVLPTIAAIRGARRKNVEDPSYRTLTDEQISRMDQYQLTKYEKLGTINPETGDYGKWDDQDKREESLRKEIDALRAAQAKEDKRLMEQLSFGNNVLDKIVTARYEAKARGGPENMELVNKLDALGNNLRYQIETAPQIIGNRYRGLSGMENIATQVTAISLGSKNEEFNELAGKIHSPIVEALQNGNYGLIAAIQTSTVSLVSAILEIEQLREEGGLGGKTIADIQSASIRSQQKLFGAVLPEYDPKSFKKITDAIDNPYSGKQSTYDETISRFVGGLSEAEKTISSSYTQPVPIAPSGKTTDTYKWTDENKVIHFSDNPVNNIDQHSTTSDNLVDSVNTLNNNISSLIRVFTIDVGAVPPERGDGKASGGYITGPGGPREDRVPIMASPGEFMINAAAAKRIGYDNLGFMNQTGKLPGFADGGVMDSWMERDFRLWYDKHADNLGINPNPDDPNHFYDYRAAFLQGAGPDETGHWPSTNKLPGHPRTYLRDEKGRLFNTVTGELVEEFAKGGLLDQGLGSWLSGSAGETQDILRKRREEIATKAWENFEKGGVKNKLKFLTGFSQYMGESALGWGVGLGKNLIGEGISGAESITKSVVGGTAIEDVINLGRDVKDLAVAAYENPMGIASMVGSAIGEDFSKNQGANVFGMLASAAAGMTKGAELGSLFQAPFEENVVDLLSIIRKTKGYSSKSGNLGDFEFSSDLDIYTHAKTQTPNIEKRHKARIKELGVDLVFDDTIEDVKSFKDVKSFVRKKRVSNALNALVQFQKDQPDISSKLSGFTFTKDVSKHDARATKNMSGFFRPAEFTEKSDIVIDANKFKSSTISHEFGHAVGWLDFLAVEQLNKYKPNHPFVKTFKDFLSDSEAVKSKVMLDHLSGSSRDDYLKQTAEIQKHIHSGDFSSFKESVSSRASSYGDEWKKIKSFDRSLVRRSYAVKDYARAVGDDYSDEFISTAFDTLPFRKAPVTEQEKVVAGYLNERKKYKDIIETFSNNVKLGYGASSDADIEKLFSNFRKGGQIPQYKEGTSYVPKDQFAYLHKGEAVIPSYANGGAINPISLTSNTSVPIEVIAKLESNIVKLDRSSVELEIPELRIENLPEGGVFTVEGLPRDGVLTVDASNIERALANLSNQGTIGADAKSSMEAIETLSESVLDIEHNIESIVNSIETRIVGLEKTTADITANEPVYKNEAETFVRGIRQELKNEIDQNISGLVNSISNTNRLISTLNSENTSRKQEIETITSSLHSLPI